MIKNGGGYDRLTWDQALFSLRFLNKILAGKAKSKSGRSSTGVKDFVSDPILERRVGENVWKLLKLIGSDLRLRVDLRAGAETQKQATDRPSVVQAKICKIWNKESSFGGAWQRVVA